MAHPVFVKKRSKKRELKKQMAAKATPAAPKWFHKEDQPQLVEKRTLTLVVVPRITL